MVTSCVIDWLGVYCFMERTILNAIDVLLPHPHVTTTNPSRDLAMCVEQYVNKIDDVAIFHSVEGREVHEAFCACCVDYLRRCAEISPEVGVSCDNLFSVAHEEKLRKCMQFLVCLGCYPLLDEGVGLPLELRLESVTYYRCPKNPHDPDRQTKLLEIAKCLLQLRESKLDQLNRLISPNLFLGDLIAALIQVAYGPSRVVHKSDSQLSPRQSHISDARRLLWKLMCDLPGHVAMKELFILQGGTAGGVKVKGSVQLPLAPNWLQKTCGHLLSRLMTRPQALGLSENGKRIPGNGVKSLLLASALVSPGVISYSDSSGCINSLDPRTQPALAQAIARILATTPSVFLTKRSSDNESLALKYHSSIAEQVLELLVPSCDRVDSSTTSPTAEDSISRFGYLVGLTAIHELCSRNAQLGRQLYLSRLFAALYRLVDTGPSEWSASEGQLLTVPDASDQCELVSPNQLTRTLDFVTDLLSSPSPSEVVLRELISLSRPLFHFLVQLLKDQAASNASEVKELFSSLHTEKDQSISSLRLTLLNILSKLLVSSTLSRCDRLNILRSWVDLPETSASFGIGDSNQTACSVTVSPCHPRLAFRHRLLVDNTDPEAANTFSVKGSRTVPYRCVLTSENIHLTVRPEVLTEHITALVELLKFYNPVQNVNEAMDDAIQHTPSFHSVFLKSHQCQSESSRDGSIEHDISTVSADLFHSLIADINLNLGIVLRQRFPEELLLPSCDQSIGNEPFAVTVGIKSSLLAAAMLENLGDRLWPQNPEQVVDLFEMTFKRLCSLLSHAIFEKDLEDFVTETLSQLLGILAFYAHQLTPSPSNPVQVNACDQFGRLLSTLNELDTVLRAHSGPINSAQLELLHCLRVMLATRGAVDLQKPDKAPMQTLFSDPTVPISPDRVSPLSASQTNRPLIQNLSEPDAAHCSSGSERPADPALQEIFDQLDDPLVPVRGHALIMLSRLLESRDQCVLGHEERLFKLLVQHLSDMDSYVYLSAIRGLAALGRAFTDRVLQAMLGRFRQLCVPFQSDSNRVQPPGCRVEYQLKLGEAIMRTLRELGEMAPAYRDVVLHTVSVGTRDPEPLVRAASLSNLAELCRLLQHAIAPVTYEIFALIEFHLIQDSSASVRQASANLARSLLLDEHLPDWLAPDVLRDLNRLLSSRAKIERDPSVLEQIEAALGELNKCARNSLFLKPLSVESLVKEIHISRPI
ncbi:hypothetical protein AHF37_04233 [Paragonimus kellicotti]|nr:hypothetical protein AHF37_04233 [Paragonimus kellicotti]